MVFLFVFMFPICLGLDTAMELRSLTLTSCKGPVRIQGPFSGHDLPCDILAHIRTPHPIIVTDSNGLWTYFNKNPCSWMPWKSQSLNGCWTPWHDLLAGFLIFVLCLYGYKVILCYLRIRSSYERSKIQPIKELLETCLTSQEKTMVNASVSLRTVARMILFAMLFRSSYSCQSPLVSTSDPQHTWSFEVSDTITICSNTSVFKLRVTDTLYQMTYSHSLFNYDLHLSDQETEGDFSRTFGQRSEQGMESQVFYDRSRPESSQLRACLNGGDYGTLQRSAVTCFKYYYLVGGEKKVYSMSSRIVQARLEGKVEGCRPELTEEVVKVTFSNKVLVTTTTGEYICGSYEIQKMQMNQAQFKPVDSRDFGEGDLTVPPYNIRFDMRYNLVFDRVVPQNLFNSCQKLPSTIEGHTVSFDRAGGHLRVSPSAKTMVQVTCPYKWVPQSAEEDCGVVSARLSSAKWDMRGDVLVVKMGGLKGGNTRVRVSCLDMELALGCGKTYMLPVSVAKDCVVGDAKVEQEEVAPNFSGMHEHLESMVDLSQRGDGPDYIRLVIYIAISILILMGAKLVISLLGK